MSGTWRAFGSTGNWQANNITPELSEFIREGDKLDYSWESNAAIGGPIRQNKLWYFAALRLSQTNTLVANTFFPDGTQADTGGHIAPNATARLTYQLNDKNKLRGAFYRQSTNTERSTLGAGIQPEAALRTPVPFPWATQVKWVSTLTNRVLLEAGQSYNYPGYVFEYQEGLGPRDVQVQYLPSNLRTTATAILPTYYTSPIYNTVGSVSYVTGSHTLKAGISYEGGYQTARYHSHGDMSMITYLNDVPSTVGVRNTPLVKREDLNADLGIYAQDKWTLRQLTLTAGMRYDHFNASVPAQSAPAGQFVPSARLPTSSACRAGTTGHLASVSPTTCSATARPRSRRRSASSWLPRRSASPATSTRCRRRPRRATGAISTATARRSTPTETRSTPKSGLRGTSTSACRRARRGWTRTRLVQRTGNRACRSPTSSCRASPRRRRTITARSTTSR